MKEAKLDEIRVLLKKYNRALVSRETGISQPTLHRICTNPDYKPRLSIVSHLALYLGVE